MLGGSRITKRKKVAWSWFYRVLGLPGDGGARLGRWVDSAWEFLCGRIYLAVGEWPCAELGKAVWASECVDLVCLSAEAHLQPKERI